MIRFWTLVRMMRLLRAARVQVQCSDFLYVLKVTPREAILFSAKLRLPKTMTDTQLDEVVTGMLDELNLMECSETMVGGALVKGLSGGERKRTSVGVELVTRPRLVFLDEPSSGLDSFNALELIRVLKKVATLGSSVLLTIHQPSSEIFSEIDRLIMLKNGRVMYGGPIKHVPRYFAKRGFPIPEHHNPADAIIFIAQTESVETLERKGFFHMPPENPDAPTVGFDDDADAQRSIKMAASVNKPGFLVQVKLLFQREMRHLIRNKKGIQARTGMTLMVSLLGGCIYWQVAESDFSDFINVQSTFGGILLALLACLFSVALPSLLAISSERPVFVREYSTNHFMVASYFLAVRGLVVGLLVGSLSDLISPLLAFQRFVTECLVTACQMLLSATLSYFMMGLHIRFGILWACQYLLALTSTALAVLVGSSVTDPTTAVEVRVEVVLCAVAR
jgi:ABC-type multidrug transport system ATPase subunit